jgi:hypothetical protein
MTTVLIPTAVPNLRNEIPLLLPRLAFDLYTIWTSLYVKCRNKQVSPFDPTALPYKLYLHKQHVFLTSFSSETKIYADFSNPAFWKRTDHPPHALFVGYGFSSQRDNAPYLKFYMKKVVLCINQAITRMVNLGGCITNFQVTWIRCCFCLVESLEKHTT